MKPFAKIYLVNGIECRFTGDTEIKSLRAFAHEKDAVKYGSEWANERNKELREQGLNVHASYQLKEIGLY